VRPAATAAPAQPGSPAAPAPDFSRGKQTKQPPARAVPLGTQRGGAARASSSWMATSSSAEAGQSATAFERS
jgi:hypothetical protein